MPENVLIAIVGFCTTSLIVLSILLRCRFKPNGEDRSNIRLMVVIWLILFVLLPYSGEVSAVKTALLTERRERISDIGLLLRIREEESYYNALVAEDWIERISRRFNAIEHSQP